MPPLCVAIATLGGLGYLSPAPGTIASLAAILVAPWVFLPLPFSLRLALLGILYGVGVWSAARTAARDRREDPGWVVIDELLGQWICLAAASYHASWKELGLALILFRLFDISKPWPIRSVERRIPGGHGIMLDDALAGLCGLGTLEGIRFAFPGLLVP